jgi:hypothetical protein
LSEVKKEMFLKLLFKVDSYTQEFLSLICIEEESIMMYLPSSVSFPFLYLTNSMPVASSITSALNDRSKATKLLRFKHRCRISRNCSCGPSEPSCIQFCNNKPVILPAVFHTFSVLLPVVINLSLFTIEKSKTTSPTKLGLSDDILEMKQHKKFINHKKKRVTKLQ